MPARTKKTATRAAAKSTVKPAAKSQSKRQKASPAGLGPLPEWNLADLYAYLRKRDSKLWIDPAAAAWGSVLGNTLERGVGYTPLGEHWQAQCGMQVVLADGTVLDTGLGAATAAKAAHLQDETNFLADLQSNLLPAVSFIKPLGPDTEHPGYTSLVQGQQHVASLVQAIQASPYWKNTAIIITYDEHGGRWDHVAPPVMPTKMPSL